MKEREKESVIRNNPGFSDWSGVSTGERCQPTRGVINPHRFRFSYYSFYKRARTKRHTEVIPQQKTNQSWKWKVWKKEDKAHRLASQGYQSLITWFKQSERDTKTGFSTTKKPQQTWRQTGSFWCELDSERHKTESCWTLDENFFSTLCIFTNNISPLLKIKII